MSELNVRGLDPDTLARLSAKAKLAGQSRESYIRDMLVHEAVVQSIGFKTQWVREQTYPFTDRSPENRLIGKGFVQGFMHAVQMALEHGTSASDVLSALGIVARPEALINTATAAAPTSMPAAAPHGIEVVSRQYTINQ